jgi:ABC-type sugar transport system ATPase subunit
MSTRDRREIVMARITFDQIAHSYYPNPTKLSDYALKEINTVWEDGGAYALLGPSGCGKTTLLNVISGLLTPSRGRVLYDDADVTDLPPEKRNIAQVFQFPVLYDTMSVFDNLAFPLRNRGFEQRRHRPAGTGGGRNPGLMPDSEQKGGWPQRRCQAENLSGTGPGAQRCGGHSLR